jgi:hypothetical protein
VVNHGIKEEICGDHVEEDNIKGASLSISLSMTRQFDFSPYLADLWGLKQGKNR